MATQENSDEIRYERFSYKDDDVLKVQVLQCAFCKFFAGGKCSVYGDVPSGVWNFEEDCVSFKHYEEE